MSKGLEKLKEIRDICSGMTNVFDEDLDVIEKELKALEIIKKYKRKEYLFWIMEEYSTWEDYLEHCIKSDIRPYIKKEEYELLKEILYGTK